ncbi:MAG: efflux RND transporter periplasmic adaptor subunit [Caulobacteraceae bacterium]
MATAPKRFRWGFLVVGALLVGMIAWLVYGNKKPARTNPPQTVAVTTTKAAVRDFPVVVTALGAAQAWQGVTIRAQVNGRLLSVPVKEGAQVRKGQLLAEIDPAPYRAVLMQAQGAERRDEAALEQARIDLQRYQTLLAQNSIAKAQADTQAALVKQLEGTVMVDKGSVAAAQVNVNYTRILSPVDGRVGVRLVDAGNLVSTQDTQGIITINEVTPIAVTFTVPQGDFQRLANLSGGFSKALATQALSQETGALLGTGQLIVADNNVDPSTGTVKMKARFPNEDRKLWPGQFVNVRMTVQTLEHAVTVPATAVNQGPNGPFVFVVNHEGADDRARIQPVKIVTTQDFTAVIQEGVKPGDTVVTDGQLSLRAGSKVRARPAGGPAGAGGGRGGPGGGRRGGQGQGRPPAS